MMTEEANRHLLKAGISVDTTELSKLVSSILRKALLILSPRSLRGSVISVSYASEAFL